jgi:hypothetical protein
MHRRAYFEKRTQLGIPRGACSDLLKIVYEKIRNKIF